VHGEPNFDHPDAFDWELLREHLTRLRAGEAVDVPVYDFKISRRLAETHRVGPCRTLIMEGIFTLWDSEIRSLFDVKVFLNVDADIRFIRRLHRDVRERGRTLDGIIRQYYDTVRPMHHEFLDPTRQYADLVIGEETDIAAQILAAKVARHADRRPSASAKPRAKDGA
jgi:uridine kinase